MSREWVFYYNHKGERIKGDDPRQVDIVSTFPLPKPSRATGTRNLPKFSFGTRWGSIIDHLLVGASLIRSKLWYWGWSYKELEGFIDQEAIKFFKDRKIRFLFFYKTRGGGYLFVRHDQCAFAGKTVVIVPPKKLEKKKGGSSR